ncbi:MAG: class I SAM-dependent methyltransferase [Solirubrobacteraceae bacterium]
MRLGRHRESVYRLDAERSGASDQAGAPADRPLQRLAFRSRRLRRLVARLWFERGVVEDTYGVVDLTEFGLGDPERIEYRPSSWRHLRRALHGCAVDRGDVFLDYGCGKGRIVHQAARLPFARVIGIEISPQLLEVAQRNLEHTRHRLACTNMEFVCADAANYELPDDVTYVYMYNPFVGEVFRAAIANVLRSLERRPRRLTLIYVHPVMEQELECGGHFRRVRDLRDRGHERIAIYEAEAA